MDKLKMHTPNLADENFKKLSSMFPNAVTETINENGELVRAIDANILQQEISGTVIAGGVERYQFTWPDKKKSVVLANQPIAKTLRLDREKSVGRGGTQSRIDTENIYIEGDNLDALKILQETYLGKVKMIYIDPPYNTGNDFIYEDDFSQSADEYFSNSGQTDNEGNRLIQNSETNGRFHTDWLNMIYPRLKIAKDFLSDDGVIFISIDDNEQNNLNKICNEIFGQDNFIGMFSVENNPKGRKNSAFISVSSEYCLVFAKNKESSYFIENVPKKASDMTLDEDGKYVHNSGKRVLVGENGFNKQVTNAESDKNYSVYYRKSDNSLKIKRESLGQFDADLLSIGYVKYCSSYKGKLIENTYTSDKFLELYKQKALSFSSDKIYEKNFSDTIRIKSQLVNREYEAIVNGEKRIFSMELTTTGAGTYLKSLFGLSEVPFSAPKNTGFLKMLASLIDDKQMITMDFFSGSASFADAIMQLNAADGGKRKFIMVQLPEECSKESVAYRAGYKTICDIGEERIRRAGKKIKDENPDANIDIGFRVFVVDSSNMKDVYYRPGDYSQEQMELFATNIKEDRTPEDLLFQVMLDLGVELSSSIEEQEINGKKVFVVGGEYTDLNGKVHTHLIACFDDNIVDDTVKSIAEKHPAYAVFRDSGMADDSVATNFEQIFETYSPETVRKVL